MIKCWHADSQAGGEGGRQAGRQAGRAGRMQGGRGRRKHKRWLRQGKREEVVFVCSMEKLKEKALNCVAK